MEKNIFNHNYETANKIRTVIKMGGKLNLMTGIKKVYSRKNSEQRRGRGRCHQIIKDQ